MIASVGREVSGDPALDTLEGGVTQEVATEEVARLHPVGLQEPGELVPPEPRVLAHRDDEAEPRRVGVLWSVRQQEPVLERTQGFEQASVVGPPRGAELDEAAQLCAADRRLHVRRLEVVADVAVDVLVVVAVGQGPELLREALAAGVVLAAGAVAVPAPVTHGPGDARQLLVVGDDHAALAHGDVVRRVEGRGRDVPNVPVGRPRYSRAESVAVVLDEPQVVFLARAPSPRRGRTGLPSVCASMMARVRGPTAARRRSGSTL